MSMTDSRKEQAIALADEIYDLVNLDNFDRVSLGAIDDVISKLVTLAAIYGRPDSEIDAAKGYLEKMKRPRADRDDLGYSLKNMAYGIRLSTHNL